MAILNGFPGLEETVFEDFKDEFGFDFPNDLKEHYLKCDGGEPDPANFLFNERYYCFCYFFQMSKSVTPNLVDIYKFWALEDRIIRPTDLPFGADPSGDLFVYSLDEETFGQIFFVSSDEYPAGNYMFKLTNSLSELMDNLVPHPDDI